MNTVDSRDDSVTTTQTLPEDATKARAIEILKKIGPDQLALSAPTKALAGWYAIAYQLNTDDLGYLLKLAMIDGAMATAKLVKTTGEQLREEGLID